jgi:ferritin
MDEKLLKEKLFEAVKKNGLLEAKEGVNNLKKGTEPKIYKLSNKVIKMLNDRITDEYYAHYLYRAAANWCSDMNYKKAAEFFNADAITELEHAQGIEKYMTDFNILPEISKTETKFTFSNLADIIYKAYAFELELMNSYNKNSQDVFQDDITTFDFLQTYRQIQKDSVIEFNDLINGLNLVDKNDKFQMLYFEQTYF